MGSLYIVICKEKQEGHSDNDTAVALGTFIGKESGTGGVLEDFANTLA